MSVIRVGKKPEDLDEITFLKEALKEIQNEQKKKTGKSFKYDIEVREQKIKLRKKKVKSQ